MLPFILYAGSGKREFTDDTNRGEQGSIDEAVAALEWLKRLDKALAWAACVHVEDGTEVWTWQVERPARIREAEESKKGKASSSLKDGE